MTKTDIKDQPLKRRIFSGKSMVFQRDKEGEKFAEKQFNLTASKEHGTQFSRKSQAQAKELPLANLTMKSTERVQTASRRFSHSTAVVNTKYFSQCFADHESPLKGTPWEDAVLGRDSLKIRKHSGQRSQEEQQCIEFLEVIG